jgi:hypothetical protein
MKYPKFSIPGALLILFLFRFALPSTAQPNLPRKVSLPEALTEISGLARNPQGDFWALADSGNPPALYRVNVITGAILETRTLPLPNRDWEELCCAPNGQLFIGDFGNNQNKRRNLAIYLYDPSNGRIDSILFHYPDQHAFPPETENDRRFDCEAVIWYADSLHLFTKSRFKGNCITYHYTLPDQAGKYTAVLKDSLHLKNHVVTGAATSPDGKTMTLTSYFIGKRFGIFPFTRAHVYCFTEFPEGQFFQGCRSKHRLPKCLLARQFESIVWYSNRYWLVANEGNGMQQQAIWRLKIVP